MFVESATPLQIAQNVRQNLDRLLASNPNKGNMLTNIGSQQEASRILRSQLNQDIETSKAPDVTSAEKAVGMT